MREETSIAGAKPASMSTSNSASAGVAVVIVTYNSAEVLGGLLDSLEQGLEGTRHYEIVVVDNASQDQSVALARQHPIRARVIETGRNGGYSAGINAAAATVCDDVDILVLNPDIRLHRGSVARMRSRLLDPTIGVVVPQILNEDGSVALSIRQEPSIVGAWSEALLGGRLSAGMGLGEVIDDPLLYGNGGTIDWATGAALLISAEARRQVGMWDETFFLYSEEVDYMERVRRTGLAVYYEPMSTVMHIGGDYQRNPYLSALLTSNRIRYFGRHHGSVSTFLFRLGVAFGEALRSGRRASHRASLRAALSPLGRV
jgi:N-acetylglucosaminyl-diphospho-decaprenol L-rhamnosyltransferase